MDLQESNYYVALALMLALLAVGLFDLAAGTSHGKLVPVTAVVKSWAREYPILVLAVGIVLGHLFW